MTNSLVSVKKNNLNNDSKNLKNVEMLNFSSIDQSQLRNSMIFSGLEAIKYNVNRKKIDLKLFEFGKEYHKTDNGKYSEIEKVSNPFEIKHRIFREILTMNEDNKLNQIELTTLADIPSGTGLGSSGAFTVSAIKAIQMFNSEYFTNESIAELACKVEIDRLKEPVGKQDQYASAIGGLTEFIFHKDDKVEFNRLPIDLSILNNIQDSILMFFTGYSRSASSILSVQDEKTTSDDQEMLYNLDAVKEMGLISRNLLIKGDIQQLGLLIQDHWEKKLKRSPDMCSEDIDKFFEVNKLNLNIDYFKIPSVSNIMKNQSLKREAWVQLKLLKAKLDEL